MAGANNRLTFVHLSDIHFRKGHANTVHDLDVGLRDAIEADLIDQLKRLRATTVDGVLVTGDIAFAGKAEEYLTAKNWLKQLCDALGVDPGEAIFCVPGNHDVDRDLIKDSVAVRDAQSAIRARTNDELDAAISERLRDGASGSLLFSPMGAYVREFAWGFGCQCTPESPYWEKLFPLNDGSELRIRGLTSTLLSGRDNEKNDLVLGRLQTTLRRKPDVTYMTLCHHPPDWCRDIDPIDDDLHGAALQLFGHKHRARVRRIDNSVRISAGAVHPDRKEGDWRPGYNIFQLWVEAEDAQTRILHLEIHAREWQEATPAQFKAYCGEHGAETWKYELPLPAWSPVKENVAMGENKDVARVTQMPVAKKGGAVSIKSLIFRFSQLPFSKQTEIITEAGLVTDDDKDRPDIERFLRAFARAEANGNLKELEERISKEEIK